jgi:hypothetical protein
MKESRNSLISFQNIVILISGEDENLRSRILQFTSDKGLPLVSIQKKGGSLEEVFYTLTHQEEEKV